MRKNITVEVTNERIIPSGRLAVAGAILGKSDFVKNCNNMKADCNHPQHQIKNGDVILWHLLRHPLCGDPAPALRPDRQFHPQADPGRKH